VLIVIDQFRYDYLTRFRAEYTGGFDRLMKTGAFFSNAYFQHFPTVTAVGHGTVLTGATPSVSGIINNEWFDTDTGARVTSVYDPKVRLLGGSGGAGASPHRLMVSTVGDELKMSGKSPSKVIGVSYKDRAAILPPGHMADGAYWFDDKTGSFVSSTFYFEDLPAWVKEFNSAGRSRQYSNREWKSLSQSAGNGNGQVLKKLPEAGSPGYFDALESSPFGNELLTGFAERAIEAERLGTRGATDLLTVSFSSNDHLGHEVGPDSVEVREMSLQTDRVIGDFFRFLDGKIGLDNILVVLTGDHGVAPLPETMAARKMPGGRLSDKVALNAVQSALTARFGEGDWIRFGSYGTFYFNGDLIRQKNLKASEVHETAAAALLKIPQVFRVYTREQLIAGQVLPDQVGRRVLNGFHVARGGDVIALLNPYWMFSGHGTTHGSAFHYDSHVPLIFMGPGVKPGRYDQNVALNDLAPTLAAMLDVETPSGSSGRVLTEMLAGR
jgi:predicted AlkP superfamily pyrophosphatase or phosphodiesterase